MIASKLKSERIKNLNDATSFIEPERIPVGIEILTWPFSYAGVNYADIIDDPEKVFESYIRFTEIVEPDFMFGGSVTHSVRAHEALGSNSYSIADDGVCVIHNQALIEFMKDGEYPDLFADPDVFTESLIRRRCAAFRLPRDQAYGKLIEALKALRTWQKANDMIREYLFGEKGIVPFPGGPLQFTSGITKVFDAYRGMRDTLLDIRKRPAELRRAADVMLGQVRENINRYDPKDFAAGYPFAYTVYHSECFLSPDQFDEFYFDPFMEICMPFMEAGVKFFVKGEGSFLRILDRYRKIPKGSVIFMLDQDDPFDVYKAIGDYQTIASGITVDLLQSGTKDQCVDYVKRCFDTFAPGGGFLFMPNKPLLCASDTKIENLAAVYETANRLSGQR